MKWERRIAGLLLILILLLVGRGVWKVYQGRMVPVSLIEEGAPYYPVYFAAADSAHLEPEFRPGTADVAAVLKDLLEGPRLPGLAPVLPPDVSVLGYTQRGSVLYVSFSHHLRSNHPGGSRAEMLTVYGIVNSLTEIAGIERVQILIEYEQIDTLTGHIDLGKPLERDYSLLGSTMI
ncbi:MAG: GerMN domain-containing protein [Firmicutes bacterium]|nr:GerMN domain-containing protein [Bacillota bacterium]NLO65958.1 GerMN domain-containing protein [Bacillota bacterium]